MDFSVVKLYNIIILLKLNLVLKGWGLPMYFPSKRLCLLVLALLLMLPAVDG